MRPVTRRAPADLDRADRRTGVLDQLNAVVLSCEVGLAKPDPAIFGVACERLSLSAGRVLFVGDDPVKDGAAARAGLPVYLLPSERDVRVSRGLTAILRLMATKDLRFFDLPEWERLPDGHPRRGMSVVAALSEWLIRTNRCLNGSWTQRYEHGVPVTDLEPVEADGTTGTCVRFLPDRALRSRWSLTAGDLERWSGH
ncbi:HAD family hydrolase [Streptomyces sp. 5-10]|uniref:HAD family hydrolase n=1 Tax=Streptomyces sp. 5-10 TaxID=878925 RepID=UPI001CC32FB7|nr:HAD-IA family hydrolase [Streptomyces sp. 5-10]